MVLTYGQDKLTQSSCVNPLLTIREDLCLAYGIQIHPHLPNIVSLSIGRVSEYFVICITICNELPNWLVLQK